MAKQTAVVSESRIPFGIVIMSVGGIVLLFIILIWLLAPQTMPAPVYRAIAPYLPQEGPIPTRMALAFLPPVSQPAAETTGVLLPESPPPAGIYPEYFVAAPDAVVVDPLAGQPVRIRIPAIALEAEIVQVELEQYLADDGESFYQWQVPAGYLVGWHNSSARVGQVGNTVLNGHHNIFGEVFRHLIDLEEGDEIIVHDRDGARTYLVTQKELLPELDQPLAVRVANARWIEPTDDERLTLVSCWPYTGNAYRLIIVAHPADS